MPIKGGSSSQGFILVLLLIGILVVLVLGYVIYKRSPATIQDLYKKTPPKYFPNLNLEELRGKLTPEVRRCIIDKIGRAEARKLVEVKQTKTISAQTMAMIRPCLPKSLGGGPAGPLPPAATPPPLTSGPFPAQKKLDTSGLVVYQTWLNYFAQNQANGQNSMSAFENAKAHLRELADMGVTMIQLSPVHPFPGHGTIGSPYGSQDYYEINPGYALGAGDREARIAQWKNYVAAAHQLGLKVIMDCVYHSTDKKNVLVASHSEYYKHNPSGAIVTNQYNFDVLDFDNGETRKYLLDMVKYWLIAVDIDGCRADVAVDVPLSFWAELNNELKKLKPGWFMVAETATKLAEYGGTYQNVYGFDALYGVKIMLALRGVINNKVTPDQIGAAWSQGEVEKIIPFGNRYYLAVDNHDQRPRAEVLSGGNGAMVAAMVFNFTFDGIPFIFNGQEIGDSAPTSISVQRFISWNKPPHPENRNIFKQVLALRKAHPALSDGTTVLYQADPQGKTVSFMRQKGKDKVLVVINFSASSWSGTVSGTRQSPLTGTLTNLLTNQTVQTANNKVALSLGADEYFIAKVKQ